MSPTVPRTQSSFTRVLTLHGPRWGLVAGLALALLGVHAPHAAAEAVPSGADVMAKMNQAYYYPGSSFRTTVLMTMGSAGTPGRERVMSMLRLNVGPSGEQKYLLYFHKPGDVRRMSCMVWKHVDLPDERWMFVPITGQVVKVLAPERSSFIGSDFMREDLSGRDVDADNHTVTRQEKLDGRDCWVIESVPKKPADFTRSVTWVDRETWLPLKQEYYDIRGKLARLFTGTRIERVASEKRPSASYPTIMDRTMRTLTSGRWTRVVFQDASYDPNLKPGDFSPERMRTPIGTWLPERSQPREASFSGAKAPLAATEARRP